MIHPERIEPGPGQESVWDYPRPPRVEDTSRRIRVEINGLVLADTRRAKRVLETSHAPVYYIPPQDVRMDLLTPSAGSGSLCEWKGYASYVDVLAGGQRVPRAGWFYPNPSRGFESIQDYLAFYAQKMEACYVDDELARPQPGAFYGGWLTDDVVGPVKGEPGTQGW